jgi:hypothetical protein
MKFDYRKAMKNRKANGALWTIHAPESKIIVTVSPVAMKSTFTGEDIVLANSYSKSTLLSAARRFARNNDNVDYFPSYEIVTCSERGLAYRADYRHVSTGIVAVIMDTFFWNYT